MKKISAILIIFASYNAICQEMEEDLFQTWTSNSISTFLDSEYKKMTVTTNRMIKGDVVTELVTKYKKSKFNPAKVNFSITYTDQYIVEERVKSNGRYIIDEHGQILKYERTDIGKKNRMMGTIYNTYTYKHGVLAFDRMRFKEYINVGAVEMDTIVTFDSLVYNITTNADTIYQVDKSSENTSTYFLVKQNKLIEKNNFINGYSERLVYNYNANGLLVMVIYNLKSEEGKSAKNVLKIEYETNGLIRKALFYDMSNSLIEEKIFTYD